jgi:hypothetical protein
MGEARGPCCVGRGREAGVRSGNSRPWRRGTNGRMWMMDGFTPSGVVCERRPARPRPSFSRWTRRDVRNRQRSAPTHPTRRVGLLLPLSLPPPILRSSSQIPFSRSPAAAARLYIPPAAAPPESRSSSSSRPTTPTHPPPSPLSFLPSFVRLFLFVSSRLSGR